MICWKPVWWSSLRRVMLSAIHLLNAAFWYLCQWIEALRERDTRGKRAVGAKGNRGPECRNPSRTDTLLISFSSARGFMWELAGVQARRRPSRCLRRRVLTPRALNNLLIVNFSPWRKTPQPTAGITGIEQRRGAASHGLRLHVGHCVWMEIAPWPREQTRGHEHTTTIHTVDVLLWCVTILQIFDTHSWEVPHAHWNHSVFIAEVITYSDAQRKLFLSVRAPHTGCN